MQTITAVNVASTCGASIMFDSLLTLTWSSNICSIVIVFVNWRNERHYFDCGLLEKVLLNLLEQGFPSGGTCTPSGTFAYLKGYIYLFPTHIVALRRRTWFQLRQSLLLKKSCFQKVASSQKTCCILLATVNPDRARVSRHRPVDVHPVKKLKKPSFQKIYRTNTKRLQLNSWQIKQN